MMQRGRGWAHWMSGLTVATAIFAASGGLAEHSAPSQAFMLEAQVVPDKLAWKPGESIRGKVRVINRGTTSIDVLPLRYIAPAICTEDLLPAPTFPPKERFFRCGGTGSIETARMVAPGGVDEYSFSIITDPLNTNGGVQLDPEKRYLLVFPEQKSKSALKLHAIPVPVEVRTGTRQKVSPRIVEAAVGSKTFAVWRENGLLEVRDLEDGRMLRSAMVACCEPNQWSRPMGNFSQDGRYFAMALPTDRTRDAGRCDLVWCDLSTAPLQLQSLELPGSWGQSNEFRLGIDSDASRIIAFNSSRILRIDCATGRIASESLGDPRSCMSDDGRKFVQLDGRMQSMLVRDTSGEGGSRQVALPATGSIAASRSHCGRDAAYFIDSAAQRAVLASYDGAPGRSIDGMAGEVVCENAAEGLAVMRRSRPDDFLSLGPSTLEVWDIAAGRRLCEIGRENRLLAISVSRSSGVACLTEQTIDGAARWYDDRLSIFDALTGTFVRQLHLDPAQPSESDGFTSNQPEEAPVP